ncbi:MAG: DUF4304 domain-containing protein [Reyranellaceae bacterium]
MFDPIVLHEKAIDHGFRRHRRQNWVRRTDDFIQLINLQNSAWSREVNYLNFALWPLALGEPPTHAENKFHFRMRANSPDELFAAADELRTLDDLRRSPLRSAGLTTKVLIDLLMR